MDSHSEDAGRGRGRRFGFAAATTIIFLVLLHGAAEFLGRRMLLPISVEDVAIFVAEPLVHRSGGRLRTTPYAEVNSVAGDVAGKQGEAWRAITLGGSFMFGDPYGEAGEVQPPGGIPFWLAERLDGATDRAVEVLNLAGLGDTSIRVREKARVLADVERDVLIVATGNNEFPLEPAPHRFILRRFALVRVVTAIRNPPQAFGDEDLEGIHRGGPDSAVLRAQYRANLRAIVDAAGSRGTPVLLATLPNNLLHTLVGEDGSWDETYAPCIRSVTAEVRGGTSRTARWVEAVASGTGEFPQPCLGDAIAAYRSGEPDRGLTIAAQCEAIEGLPYAAVALAQVGRGAEAVALLELWVESKPWGIRPSFNAVVRAVAAEHDGVHLVDLQAAAVADGVPAAGMFLDAVHMHWTGYATMNEVLLKALTRARLAPGEVSPPPPLDQLMQEHGLPRLPPSMPEVGAASDSWSCPASVPKPEAEPQPEQD